MDTSPKCGFVQRDATVHKLVDRLLGMHMANAVPQRACRRAENPAVGN